MELVPSCPECKYTFAEADSSCPRCWRVRPLGRHVSDEISVSANERLIAEGRGDSGPEALRNSRGPQSSGADWSAHGVPTYYTAGENRHGEQGSLDVASRLVIRLNQDGAQWGDVVEVRKVLGVDCIATDAGDPARKLKVQVTRAVGGQVGRELRRELKDQGRVVRQVPSADEAADELRESIEAKLKKYQRQQLTGDQMREITLALDAEETLAHLSEPIRDSFRRRNGEWAASCGFAAIWLVGPTVEWTFRLAPSA